MRSVDEYNNFLRDTERESFFTGISERRLAPPHDQYLAELLQEHSFPNILEIGRYKGYSLGLFKFFAPTSLVVSVDIELHPEVFRIVRNHPKVILVNGCSDVVNNFGIKFDLVLIDGDHSYEWAKIDWENALKNTKPGSIVLFDDLGREEEHSCGKVFYELPEGGVVKRKWRRHNLGYVEVGTPFTEESGLANERGSLLSGK